jgi:uncharacterized membrane protein YhaH (DUF805 family)
MGKCGSYDAVATTRTLAYYTLIRSYAMNIQESVTVCLKKYVEFDGRASRSELWWFILAQVIVGIIANTLHPTLGGIVSLLLFLPTIAVGARRLHDINKTGWLQLVGIIPIIGWILVIYWFVQPTQPEGNKYGEPPAVQPV